VPSWHQLLSSILAFKLNFSFYVQLFKTSHFPVFSQIFKYFQGTSIFQHTFSKKLNKLFPNKHQVILLKYSTNVTSSFFPTATNSPHQEFKWGSGTKLQKSHHFFMKQ